MLQTIKRNTDNNTFNNVSCTILHSLILFFFDTKYIRANSTRRYNTLSL
jgi:hypothetical protein